MKKLWLLTSVILILFETPTQAQTWWGPKSIKNLCGRLLARLEVCTSCLQSERAAISIAADLIASKNADKRRAGKRILRLRGFTPRELRSALNKIPSALSNREVYDAAFQSKALWRNGPPLNRLVDEDVFTPGRPASTEATELLTYSDRFVRFLTTRDLNWSFRIDESRRWYEALAAVMTEKDAHELAEFISGRGPNPWNFTYVFEPGPDYEYFAEIDRMRLLLLKIPRALYLLQLWEKRQPRPTYRLSKQAVHKMLSKILIAEYPRAGFQLHEPYFAHTLLETLRHFDRNEIETFIRARVENSKNRPRGIFHPTSRFELDFKLPTIQFFDELDFWIDFEKLFHEKDVERRLIGAWQFWRADGRILRVNP